MMSTMGNYKFVSDLPERRRIGRPLAYPTLVEECKSHPGQWAQVKEFPARSGANSAAENIRKRYGLETAVRKQSDGGCIVYARYNQEA